MITQTFARLAVPRAVISEIALALSKALDHDESRISIYLDDEGVVLPDIKLIGE